MTDLGITYEEANPPEPHCKRCGKKLGTEAYDVHTCTPKQPEPEELARLEQAMLEVWQDVPGAVNFGIKPQPVAWRFYDGNMWCYVDHLTDLPQDKFEPLYTTPPKKEWVGLTKEELAEIAEFHFHGAFSGREVYEDIETRLKEKNT